MRVSGGLEVIGKLFFISMLFLAATAVDARQMQLTIYDDGRSCPGNCDAHVVMSPSNNGTVNAFQPGTTRDAPEKCVVGEDCEICFGDSADSCMIAKYRGDGPDAGRFDFTPAFYAENCARPDIPSALKNQCRSLDNAAKRLNYLDAINCFQVPDDLKCKRTMDVAKGAQDADEVERKKCVEMGQAAYNATQSDAKMRRTDECNYSALKLGGRPGHRWHKLLPGACRPGTYVDPAGLDCCSGDIRFAAANHPECRSFFPLR